MTDEADFHLDLRGIKCPMNFVKTKLLMEKMSPGNILKLALDVGEPLESVSKSVEAEGHVIFETFLEPTGYYLVSIRKG